MDRRDDEDKLPASTLRAGDGNLLVTRLKLPQPPLIPVSTIGRVLLQGLLQPVFADDLFSLPATALQDEIANLRHVARPQTKTAAGLDDAIGIFQPRIIRDAERTKKMALGKLVRPQPGSFVNDLTENNGNATAIGKPGPRRCNDWPFEGISHRIF